MFTLRLLGSASLDGPDGPVTGRAALRQRIALLALLAVEHPRPLSRDKLVAYLWPESGTDDARHLLRESLYILRSALGEDSVLSTGDDLRLNPDRLTCDLWEFEAALARDDLEAAVGVYHGPFLSGFHLSEAEEFEHWADGERSRLARRYGQALEQLAEREMRGGDRCGRSSGGPAWRGRIPTTPGSRCGTCRPWRRPVTGRGRSGTRARIPSCCAPISTRRRSGGDRAGGTAQAGVAGRPAARRRRLDHARRSVPPDGDRPETGLAFSRPPCRHDRHATAGSPRWRWPWSSCWGSACWEER